MGLSEIGISIRDDLRNALSDPLGDPVSNTDSKRQWIHYDSLNRLEGIGKTPCIFIERVGTDERVMTVGTAQTDDFFRYNINVVVSNTDRGAIDGITINNSEEILDKLVDKIDARLKSVYVTIDPDFIISLIPLTVGGTWNYNKNTKACTSGWLVQKV